MRKTTFAHNEKNLEGNMFHTRSPSQPRIDNGFVDGYQNQMHFKGPQGITISSQKGFGDSMVKKPIPPQINMSVNEN